MKTKILFLLIVVLGITTKTLAGNLFEVKYISPQNYETFLVGGSFSIMALVTFLITFFLRKNTKIVFGLTVAFASFFCSLAIFAETPTSIVESLILFSIMVGPTFLLFILMKRKNAKVVLALLLLSFLSFNSFGIGCEEYPAGANMDPETFFWIFGAMIGIMIILCIIGAHRTKKHS